MNLGLALDIIVLIVLFGSVLIAFFRGFIREVLTIFGIVGGILASYIGGPVLVPLMNDMMGVVEGADPVKYFGPITDVVVATGLAYAVVLITFSILFSVAGHYISKSAKKLGLGALDRTLGVVFGLVRGVLVLGIMYILPYHVIGEDEKKEYNLSDSRSLVYLETTTEWISGFLPKSAEDKIEQAQDSANNITDTRKKLEELDVLGNGVLPTSDDINHPTPKADGYEDEFRNKMDKLFEQSNDAAPNYNE